MKSALWLLGLLLGLAVVGCNQPATTSVGDEGMAKPVANMAMDDDDDDDDGVEEEIPLGEVPQNVKDAALAAVPGIVFSEAEMETVNGVVTYDLEGMANGKRYEVEVSSSGTVIEVEDEDDDDDDDDDDDHDGN